MPELEDVVIQLLLAALYFGAAFVTASVILPSQNAIDAGLVGLILAMIGYLVLRALGLHKPGPAIGIYIGLGFALLTFGFIWWIVRVILEALDLWPFIDSG